MYRLTGPTIASAGFFSFGVLAAGPLGGGDESYLANYGLDPDAIAQARKVAESFGMRFQELFQADSEGSLPGEEDLLRDKALWPHHIETRRGSWSGLLLGRQRTSFDRFDFLVRDGNDRFTLC